MWGTGVAGYRVQGTEGGRVLGQGSAGFRGRGCGVQGSVCGCISGTGVRGAGQGVWVWGTGVWGAGQGVCGGGAEHSVWRVQNMVCGGCRAGVLDRGQGVSGRQLQPFPGWLAATAIPWMAGSYSHSLEGWQLQPFPGGLTATAIPWMAGSYSHSLEGWLSAPPLTGCQHPKGRGPHQQAR